MSDLLKVDSILDECICIVREMRKNADEVHMDSFLHTLVDKHPEFALIGAAYHLGMLLIDRNDCELDELDA